VFCTVLNSTYDTGTCSCDEQMSVFDTCVSEYPCLKVYVSYVITAPTTTPTTTPPPQSSSQNSSSGDEHDRRRQRRSAAAPLDAAVVDNSSTPPADPSDDDGRRPGQLAEVVDAQAHYDDVENQLSRLNVSLNDNDVAALRVTTAASPAATDSRQTSRDRVAGNGSGPVTSYRIAGGTRRYATEYDYIDLTLTTTSDVNRSYVAQLYRSWDDSFLPQVIVNTSIRFFSV